MTQNPSINQQHYDCLDGLRAVLAIYVVLYHCWLGASVLQQDTLSPAFLFLGFGRYAVCFFIVISGFCLMLPTLKREYRLQSLRGFLARRAWRILPPYYFALLLSIAIDLPLNGRTGSLWNLILPVTPDNALSHGVLVQNFVPGHFYKINGAFWSIAVEWQIYFLFPLLLLVWRTARPIAATSGVIAIALLVEMAFNQGLNCQPCLHFAGLFALGMLAAWAATSGRDAKVNWGVVAMGALVLFVAATWSSDQLLLDVLFGLLAAIVLVILFLRPEGVLHRALAWGPLVFVGSFSYSIYLMHLPILVLLWALFLPDPLPHINTTLLLFIGGGLPMVLAFSYLFHLGCERPFLRVPGRHIVHIS